jgi:alkanesulfonate monooxygenase SsuD/methylene tetrahydromethanopterin reductase-like flavin-dependent oxidoreductase (luciferase family)
MSLMTLPWFAPTFDTTRAVVAAFRGGVSEGGHEGAGCEALGYLSAYVGETPESARAEADVAWERWRRIGDDQRGGPEPVPLTYDIGVATSRAIFGDPATCRAHVARLRDELGLDRLALRFDFGGLPQDLVLASMRRFATEVAPWFTS